MQAMVLLCASSPVGGCCYHTKASLPKPCHQTEHEYWPATSLATAHARTQRIPNGSGASLAYFGS